MIMKNLKLIIVFILVFNFACEKNSESDIENGNIPTFEEAQQAIEDYIVVSEQFKNALSAAEEAELTGMAKAESGKKISNSLQDTVLITISPLDLTTFPKTITADFGTNGILGPDKVMRKGKIISSINKWRHEEGSIRNTFFEDYFHNSCQIIGDVTSENLGENTDGYLTFQVDVDNGQYVCNELEPIYFNRTSTISHIAGQDTEFDIWDDEYTVDAIEECVTSDSIKLTITTTETLVYSTLTKVKSGVLSVEIENFLLPIVINYNTKEISIGIIKIPFE